MPPENPGTGNLTHVVVLDDDPELRILVAEYLEQHEFRVTTAASGREARQVIARDPAAAIILDLMMPDEDGLSVLRSLAGQPAAPAMLMLSAMGSDTDRIVGIELGADDYLAKPVNPRELLARLRAVLRRGRAQLQADTVDQGGWTFEAQRLSLTAPDGREVDLTSGEFRLLFALARRAGRIVSRDDLLDETHGSQDEPHDRAIDVAISRLRTKLARYGGENVIRTVRGEGYLFVGSS